MSTQTKRVFASSQPGRAIHLTCKPHGIFEATVDNETKEFPGWEPMMVWVMGQIQQFKGQCHTWLLRKEWEKWGKELS
jgi:hypothetical protein